MSSRKDRRLAVRITSAQHTRLFELSEAEGAPVSKIVRSAVRSAEAEHRIKQLRTREVHRNGN